MKKVAVLFVAACLLALPLAADCGKDHAAAAGGKGHGSTGCCAKQEGVERTVTNLDNGVQVSLTASDPKVVEMLQTHSAMAGKDGCGECPMKAEGVTRSVEKTATGVVMTATATTPEAVKALQQHAAQMATGGCMKKTEKAGCAHKADKAKCTRTEGETPTTS